MEPEHRSYMAKYLIDNQLLIGKTRSEVIERLGKAKSATGDYLYKLRFERHASFNFDRYFLQIRFDETKPPPHYHRVIDPIILAAAAAAKTTRAKQRPIPSPITPAAFAPIADRLQIASFAAQPRSPHHPKLTHLPSHLISSQ